MVSGVVGFRITDAICIENIPKARKKLDMSEKEEDADESDAVLSDATSDIQMLESDVGSVCDAEESSMSDAEGPLQEENCPQASSRVTPLPSGSLTVWSNGYFTLCNDARFPDAKLVLRPRFAVPEELGSTEKSKTLTILRFDRRESEPFCTYLCLRAWMIWRCQRGSWHTREKARFSWWQGEREQLFRDCREQDLSEPAGKLIADWCPDVL